MEFYEAVYKRRTVRDFTDEPVADEVIKRIVGAALAAPSNDHMRSWEFIVLSDREKIAEVLHKIPKKFSDDEVSQILKSWDLNDPVHQRMYRAGIPMQYDMLYRPGRLILPFYKQKSPIFQANTLSDLNEYASIWCCVENILLAASAEGLGCALRIPLGDEHDYVKSVLNVPNDYIMPCYLSIGHIAPDAHIAEQHAVDINSKLHWNGWENHRAQSL